MKIQERVVSVNAAILVCRSAQRKNAVHRLRSVTRRAEAQLILLEISQILSSDMDEVGEVRKRLTKIRRAAGMVRDLDVQIELIFEHERTMAKSPDVAHKNQMSLEARRMRRHLRQRRGHEAVELVRTLRRQAPKMSAALKTLESKVSRVKQHALPEEQLVMRIERWFYAKAASNRCLPRMRLNENGHRENVQVVEGLDNDGLHRLRKLAKLCRYMAEDLECRSSEAKNLAKRFEEVQKAGGLWHDWLLLGETAAKLIGRHAELAESFAARRDTALAEYRLELAGLLRARANEDKVQHRASK